MRQAYSAVIYLLMTMMPQQLVALCNSGPSRPAMIAFYSAIKKTVYARMLSQALALWNDIQISSDRLKHIDAQQIISNIIAMRRDIELYAIQRDELILTSDLSYLVTVVTNGLDACEQCRDSLKPELCDALSMHIKALRKSLIALF